VVDRGFCTYPQVYEALALQRRVEHPAEAVVSPVGGKLRVVLVDDSELACEMVTDGLTARGYEVVAFQNPYEALEAVGRLKPAILITDLEMPGIDGVGLCQRLKQGPARSVPVIILTGNNEDTDRVEGLRAGADDYILKSASLDEIVARIESVLRRTGETERMRKLFARYTSDAVVEEILKGPDVVLTGERLEVTTLFADLRNFTGLADSLAPERTVGLLNTVLGRLSEAVLTCGGTLDKFLGDGLMAVFGAPVRRDDDPLRAWQAAHMMMEAMKEIRAAGESAGEPLLELGIGLNTGVVVAGNIGGSRRTEYTCIGDAVNVAARLCALAGPGEILVGERTRELLPMTTGFEPLPPVLLKGKAHPTPLFRACP